MAKADTLGDRLPIEICPDEEPETDGEARIQYMCPRTRLAVLAYPSDYEIVSSRVAKIKVCQHCSGTHHLRLWGSR